MKKGLVLAMMGVGISMLAVGCSTYSGGMGDDSGMTYGTAADLRSPSGLDRAKGEPFEAMPPIEDDALMVPESDLEAIPEP